MQAATPFSYLVYGLMNEMALDNSHDIFLDGDHICRIGNIAKKVRQAVLCLLKTEEGEAFTNIEHGVPWLEKITGLPVSHLDVAQRIIREKIEAVKGVKSVIAIDLATDGRNLTGKFSVQSVDGSTINGDF